MISSRSGLIILPCDVILPGNYLTVQVLFFFRKDTFLYHSDGEMFSEEENFVIDRWFDAGSKLKLKIRCKSESVIAIFFHQI